MTETHTHPNEYPHAENEAAPSAAQHPLGKNRFRFLHREQRHQRHTDPAYMRQLRGGEEAI